MAKDHWLGDKLKFSKGGQLDPKDLAIMEANVGNIPNGALYGNGLGIVKGKTMVATTWRNRLPICPYGCRQEGQLKEVIIDPDTKKAMGVYRDSEGLVFTAPMKMQPKPSDKKIEIGPDGEPHLVTEDN